MRPMITVRMVEAFMMLAQQVDGVITAFGRPDQRVHVMRRRHLVVEHDAPMMV